MKVESAIMLPIKINGRVVQFELDTGASVSIIDEETWHKIGKPKITSTNLEAMAHNNSPICLKCLLALNFEGRTETMDVYVLPTANHPLRGRDMIKKLAINCGPYVRSIVKKSKMTDEDLRKEITRILNKNKSLF